MDLQAKLWKAERHIIVGPKLKKSTGPQHTSLHSFICLQKIQSIHFSKQSTRACKQARVLSASLTTSERKILKLIGVVRDLTRSLCIIPSCSWVWHFAPYRALQSCRNVDSASIHSRHWPAPSE
jgi:hypothetical protein